MIFFVECTFIKWFKSQRTWWN